MPRAPNQPAVLAAVLAALCIAGCGGASHSSSSAASNPTGPGYGHVRLDAHGPSTRTTGTPTSASSPTRTSSPASVSSTTSTITEGPTSTAATTSGRPPEVPKGKGTKRPHRTAPSSDVRIPALFLIGAGGVVTPPLISAPSGVTIQLRLRNRDSKPHTVQLSAGRLVSVRLGPTQSVTTAVTGLHKGTYRMLVDGSPRAQLVIGAVPGP